jgi:dethiobiotin synthetase/adenosylmethionine--8-amino-7-oxononanoate aminotransferase
MQRNFYGLAFQVWGANTNVGKTLVCAALARAHLRDSDRARGALLYLKPLQTGFPSDHDARFVFRQALGTDTRINEPENALEYVSREHAFSCRTLYAWRLARSPQEAAAAATAGEPFSHASLQRPAGGLASPELDSSTVLEHIENALKNAGLSLFMVETAGGVLSPVSASGTLQADFYRAVRLPGVLVGDARLGGISTTLAAYEALRSRGYDVPAIVFGMGPGLESADRNAAAIRAQLDPEETPIVEPYLRVFDAHAQASVAQPAQGSVSVDETAQRFIEHLRHWWCRRAIRWQDMLRESDQVLWWPFTQHQARRMPSASEERAQTTLIDSAYGDDYTIIKSVKRDVSGMSPQKRTSSSELTQERWFDGCGSWWTQSVGHGHPTLNRSIGNALGRYGHVMFPECVHEPAWLLSKRLLNSVGNGWASRVFFSDNGSTAMEIGLKMAFRLAQKRGLFDLSRASDVGIVGLEGSYHGDTLGAMDCSPSSTFNHLQTPWYRGRGLFLKPPYCAIWNGDWQPDAPQGLDAAAQRRRHERYREYHRSIAEELARHESMPLGALVLEPVVQGAGGMRIIDVVYQQALIDACRQRAIPVVFDEVFTAFWRLGALTGASILDREPDIAAYGKLLTGGALPLAVTLSSEEVFTAFLGEKRADALLHGHSYSAYPAGCAAANAALSIYERLTSAETRVFDGALLAPVRALSTKPGVGAVSAIGSVLAVQLTPLTSAEQADGRLLAARQTRVLSIARQQHGIYLRPLGTTVYALVAPAQTPLHRAADLVRALDRALDLAAVSKETANAATVTPIV